MASIFTPLLGSALLGRSQPILLAFALGVSSPLVARAQDSKPTTAPVFVASQCSDDSVGERVAYYVREGINRSTTMRTVDRYVDSVIRLSLVCSPPVPRERGGRSAYSYQITLYNFDGYYDFALTHGVGVCGSDRVKSCADGLVATTSTELSALRARLADEKFEWP